jgi:hypothetical protein
MKIYLTTFLLALACCFLTGEKCQAQYITGVGLRAGKFASGIDVKHFLSVEHQTGIEFYGGYTREAHGGYYGKLFYFKQATINKSNIPFPFRYIFRQSRLQIPLTFIYGGGVHAGYFEEDFYSIHHGDVVNYADGTMSAGIDAMCGFEYSTRRFPFAISIDVTPFYSFINPGPEWIDFGVTARYVFR